MLSAHELVLELMLGNLLQELPAASAHAAMLRINEQLDRVPGVFFGEHIPKFAKQMHRCTVIRSAHHSVNNAHALAVYTAMTGDDRGDANKIVANSASDQPAPGAVLVCPFLSGSVVQSSWPTVCASTNT